MSDGSPPDDRALAARAVNDRNAFAELYRRYVGPVYAFARRRTGSADAAEEVTAATFERAMRAMPGFRWRGGGFEPWLYRIAANELVEHYRRLARARRPVPSAGGGDGDPADAFFEALPDERIEALRVALATLSDRYQRAITLRYLSGLTNEAAATAMGTTRPAMAVTLHRAMTALRKAMVDEGNERR